MARGITRGEQAMNIPLHAPPVRRLALDSFQPGTLEEAVSGGAIDHVQLSAGRFLGELLHAEIDDRVFDYGSYNLPLLASGGMPSERVVLGFVASDGGEGNLNGMPLADEAIVVIAEGGELHYRLAPHTRWMGFQVARESLEACRAALGPASVAFPSLDSARRDEVSQVVADAVEVLRAIAARSPDILDPAAAGKVVSETLFAAFAGSLPSDDDNLDARSATRQRRLRIVRRARDYFEANLSHPIQVTQFCDYLGASMKAVERAFCECCGVNPKELLTLTRMTRARRALLAAQPGETTIAQVAIECGFFHLGRFSAKYAKLYGESPSLTLRWDDGSAARRRRSHAGHPFTCQATAQSPGRAASR
jgi:AraC family transcriptional regulator, ethanolamine operon transcriptional activator